MSDVTLVPVPAGLRYRRLRRFSRNPLGIIVPCHRILGSNGSLTGYAGGLQRKRALLALENASWDG